MVLQGWSPHQQHQHPVGTCQKWASLGLTQASKFLDVEPSQVCLTSPPGASEACSRVRTTGLEQRERWTCRKGWGHPCVLWKGIARWWKSERQLFHLCCSSPYPKHPRIACRRVDAQHLSTKQINQYKYKYGACILNGLAPVTQQRYATSTAAHDLQTEVRERNKRKTGEH